MAAGDRQIRNWLSAAGLDRESGNSLAELIAERATYWAGVKDRTESGDEAEKALRRVYKGDYARNMAVVTAYVDDIEAEQPGLKAFLRETNLGNDPMTIHQLWVLAERFADR